MEWWQIVLIFLGSTAVGIFGAVLLSRLINRFIKERFLKKGQAPPVVEELRREVHPVVEEPRREVHPVVEELRREVYPVVDQQKRKEAIRMVPLLSRRCIIVLAIGLVVGAGLGAGYWAVSPINPEIKVGWPPIRLTGITEPPPTIYSSTMDFRIATSGGSYTSLKTLQRHGEYYAFKMNTFSFWEFLSGKVTEQAPQYSRSPEELAQMLRVRYDWKDDSPGTIEIMVTSTNDQEAFFLTSITAQVFRDYLVAEERKVELEKFQNKLKELEMARAALLEAEKELASLALQENGYDFSLDPDYIALKAKIEALETELDTRAGELAVFIAEGDTGEDYIDAVEAIERASTALGEARSELSSLEVQANVEHLEQRLTYVSANTKVERLSKELDGLTKSVTSSLIANGEASQVPNFYPVGEPLPPAAIPPERVRGRNALVMGAMLGLGGAWLVLNGKWLASGMPSSPEVRREEEDEEDEA